MVAKLEPQNVAPNVDLFSKNFKRLWATLLEKFYHLLKPGELVGM
jgi:hypothetical protein